MQKLKDHFHLIIITLGILIILPVAYYFLYALPNYNLEKLKFEKQKYEVEQQKVVNTESKKDEQKNLLDSCLLQADFNYRNLWESECRAWKVQVDDAWKNCRANKIEILKDTTYDLYGTKVSGKVLGKETDEENRARCTITTPDYNIDENDSCLLPKTRSKDVEQKIKDQKDECYRKYSTTY